VNVSGIAINSNKADAVFDVNAGQYTSHYKTNKTLSVFPVRCNFASNKYKLKKPIPNENSYVAVEGSLGDIENDSTGQATLFHVSVDNINFLGKATISSSTTNAVGENLSLFFFKTRGHFFVYSAASTNSRSSHFKYNFDDSTATTFTQGSATASTGPTATGDSETGPLTRAGKRKK
jgi:hypothetical protein